MFKKSEPSGIGSYRLLAGLVTGGLLILNTAWGGSNYAPAYTFITIAGTAGHGDNVDGTNGAAAFYYPTGVALDTNGNLYVVDDFENTVRKAAPVGTNWVVTTIAGTPGANGHADGTNSNATFYQPAGVAADGTGNLYVADTANNIIRRITPVGTNWVVTTIAGTANPNGGTNDGTNATAQFNFPDGIAADAAGNIYVADTVSTTIRKITPVGTNWVVTTIAGNAANPGAGSFDGTNLDAQFSQPYAVAVDQYGNLFVADSSGSGGAIRKITPVGTNWVTTTIAGVYNIPGTDDGTNTAALFESPFGITVDVSNNVYVADTGANNIRKLSLVGTNWVSTTLAGPPTPTPGYANGTGANVRFYTPWGIAVDAAGSVYVADDDNDVIREGFVVTVPNPAISLAGPNSPLVSWPDPFGTLQLQTNADLATTNWGNYAGTVNRNNNTNSVNLSPAAGKLFFRLTQP